MNSKKITSIILGVFSLILFISSHFLLGVYYYQRIIELTTEITFKTRFFGMEVHPVFFIDLCLYLAIGLFIAMLILVMLDKRQ